MRLADGVAATAGGHPLTALAADTSEAEPARLTLSRDKLLAVLPDAGRIMGFDLSRDGALVFDAPDAGPNTGLVGHAIVHGSRAIVGEAVRGDVTQTALACYDLGTGALQWRRSLGWSRGPNVDAGPARADFNIACDGAAVYVNTGSGLVAAVHAADGEPVWLRIYDCLGSRSSSAASPPRLVRSTLLSAPAEGLEILALDAASGAVRWAAPRPGPAVGVLAVDEKFVYLDGDRLRRISLDEGALDDGWGRDVLNSVGQGTIAGELIYWPTALDVVLVDRHTGEPTGETLTLPAPGGANVSVIESTGEDAERRETVVAAAESHVTGYGR